MDGNREHKVFLNKDCTVCDHTLIGWIHAKTCLMVTQDSRLLHRPQGCDPLKVLCSSILRFPFIIPYLLSCLRAWPSLQSLLFEDSLLSLENFPTIYSLNSFLS